MSDSGQDKFYRPYVSDNETGSGSTSGTSTPTSSSSDSDKWSFTEDQISRTVGGPNFQALAQNLFKNRSDLMPEQSTITQSVSEIYANIGDSLLPDSIKNNKNNVNTTFNTEITRTTSILTIDSANRDKKVFPQPTYCVLRFPKLYRNIVSITFAEIKLLTSIYFFSKTKGNTDITIYEKGRTYLDDNNNVQSTIIKTYINDGSYSIANLATQLQNQLNKVPLFYDYINGFNDFLPLFISGGDLAIVFNQPGDFYYDADSELYVDNPTTDIISSHFWISRYPSLQSYSLDNSIVGYYYPVLKYYYMNKLLDDINLSPGLGIDPDIITTEDVFNRIMYSFQGLSDTVVIAVIRANTTFLDKYRLQNTFRYSLVNQYTVTVNPQTQYVSITSTGLNTSLSNLIVTQQSIYLNQALSNLFISQGDYNNLAQSNIQLSAVIQGMFNFYQTQFVTYFGVPWNQYSLSYYMNSSNPLLLRNGQNASNIPSNSTEAYAAGITTYSNSIFTNQSSISYWPSFSNVTNTVAFTNLSNITSSFNYTYSPTLNTITSNNSFISKSNILYSQLLTNSATVVCPIQAGKYTVIRFINPVRQTLEIETLPRPTAYRLPLYNKSNYDSLTNKYFNMSYTFTSNLPYVPKQNYTTIYDNLTSNSIIQIPGWSNNTTWELSYISSLAYYNYTANRINITNLNGSLYYQFTTPTSSTPLLNSTFTYSLNLSFSFYSDITITNAISTLTDYTAFVYHDRAAFMADANLNATRNENPYFYKYSLYISTNTDNNNLQFTTYPNQTYYVTLRPNKINGFPTSFVAVVPWFPSSNHITTQSLSITDLNPSKDVLLSNFSTLVTTNFNYAQVYDSNWIQLPITSSLLGKYSGTSNFHIITSNLPMGHDTNGISTDFLDYIPFVINSPLEAFNPSINLGIDPINNYLFQSNSPYIGTYIYPVGNNTIMTPGIRNQYFPTTVTGHEYKIIHYYSVTYLPESVLNTPYFNSNYITNTPSQLPYNLDTTNGVPISGYTYDPLTKNLQLDRGVIGFSFIPGKGVWDLKRFMFRSAISDSNNDPNRFISYLGIYLLSDIINQDSVNLQLSNALVVLSNSARVTYTSTFTEVTGGFDTKGGTYYEFTKDSSFSNVNLLGYSQNPNTMINQPESIYVCVSFTKGGSVNTIKALSGSSIPYPYYNGVYTSSIYLDGSSSYTNGQGVLFPSTIGQTQWQVPDSTAYAPIQSPTQSIYGNSIPIGTSVVIYKKYSNILVNNNFLKPWAIPSRPTTINVNVVGFMLLQDSQINIYEYNQYDISYQFTNPVCIFTIDEIFSSREFTSLQAITGNDTYYYFLGFSSKGSITTIRIKQFNPVTGEMLEMSLPTFNISPNGIIKSFTINNINQLVIIYQIGTLTTFYYTAADFRISPITSNSLPLVSTATHAMNADSTTLYWLQQNTNDLGNIIYEWNLSSNFPGIKWTCSDSSLFWNQIAMITYDDIPDIKNRLFLTNTLSTTTNTIYYTSNWSSNNFFLDTINKPDFTVQSIYSGYSGSMWVIDANNLVIWGNRNQQVDIPGLISPAWQMFYPFQKITLERVNSNYDPMTDLRNISYPEYPHTQLFYYDNTLSYNNDIPIAWGLEKNSMKSDTSFNGYYFNSHISPFSISKSKVPTDYKYIVIRGYTPTENSEVLLRFVIPNKYTFGYVTTNEIINEISNTYSNIDIDYSTVLSNFNSAFNQNTVFGSNLIPNFNGQEILSSNFNDFNSQLTSLYTQFSTINANTTTINSYINTNISNFIGLNLSKILPSSALKSQVFTSPLLFSILWNSSLLPLYKSLTDNWGLGYNLGFKKLDSPYSIQQKSSSFYKILEDYLYLRLSPEYSINTLDVTKSENLSLTRESTGSIKEYYGKLLLGDFNTYSRTFISNQVTFNPPIAKLDKLSFEWIDPNGVRLNNNDCEWNGSIVITEYGSTQTLDSLIPGTQPVAQAQVAQAIQPPGATTK